MHYLPMSFPYSNHEVCEVFADEKDVCVCQGLKDCFEHIGGESPRHRARQRHRGHEEVARRDRGVRHRARVHQVPRPLAEREGGTHERDARAGAAVGARLRERGGEGCRRCRVSSV